MCGIAGIVGTSDPGAVERVARMADTLRHRGPDDLGVESCPGAVLGHTRLSIIDLGGGHQPMPSWDRRYWIVFNGEIYNYKDIRRGLEQKGHRFHTQSDTEVLMELFRARGLDGLSETNGMFSFAIWDTHERTLSGGRDRLGKKPFFYATGKGGEFVFASELKAILASGLVEPKVDPAAVDAYLALGYVPPHLTIYSNVSTLPPAHSLTWAAGRVAVRRYWAARFEETPLSEEQAVEGLRDRLNQAVLVRRLASDVPVGAFLSGGLDSSTVVILAQKQTPNPIQTFTVHIQGHSDETPYARAVAKQIGADHHEVDVDVNVADLLRQMAGMYDEPFADPSNIPTHLVSKYARDTVKVVLTGDGGDEMFGGYDNWYLPLAATEGVPNRGWRYHALRLADNATGRGPLHRRRIDADHARCFPEVLDRHFRNLSRFRPDDRCRLLNRDLSYAMDAASCPTTAKGIGRAFWFDVNTYLPGDILVKVDRASMAVGLETRAPILDVNVVEFSLSLPHRMKVAGGVCKRIFRKAFGGIWPESLRNRPKLGFGVPEDRWLRLPEVRGLAEETLLDRRAAISSLLEAGVVAEQVRGFYEGRPTLSPIQMWTLLTLGIWAARPRADSAEPDRVVETVHRAGRP
jgi:asparagine synthase (glutamine-hydrolysing)